MNKAKAKRERRDAAKADKVQSIVASAPDAHPYDDIAKWVGADFTQPPESKEWVAAYQKRLDDAFGHPGAFVLAWSGDRRYWEEFYTDWYADGGGKPDSLERKPLVLWKSFQVNDRDYYYISPPRWLILEVHHPGQYGPSWKASGEVSDPQVIGGIKRIRPAAIPERYYVWFKTIARHEKAVTSDATPPCCVRAAEASCKCFGKYRLPDESDLEFIRKMRKWMDENGTQRPDEPLTAKSLNAISVMTKHYVKEAQAAKLRSVREFAIENPMAFVGTAMTDRGIKMSPAEINDLVKDAFDRIEQEEAEKDRI